MTKLGFLTKLSYGVGQVAEGVKAGEVDDHQLICV